MSAGCLLGPEGADHGPDGTVAIGRPPPGTFNLASWPSAMFSHRASSTWVRDRTAP